MKIKTTLKYILIGIIVTVSGLFLFARDKLPSLKIEEKIIDYIAENVFEEIILEIKKADNYNKELLDEYVAYAEENSELKISEVVKIINLNLDIGFYEEIVTIKNDSAILVLVNKYYKLDKSYIPLDLEQIDLSYSYANRLVRKEVHEAFVEMAKAAELEGINLTAISAYRSYEKQNQIYNSFVDDRGVALADQTSTRPGHSEHQTGLAIDVNSASTSDNFENTIEGKWLNQNANTYGFIIRYELGKEDITGYSFEPWHLRYVGTKAAKELKEQELTLEEYLLYQKK